MSSCDCAGVPRGWAERSMSALPTWDHPVPVRPGSEAHSALPGAVLTPWSAPVTFGEVRVVTAVLTAIDSKVPVACAISCE